MGLPQKTTRDRLASVYIVDFVSINELCSPVFSCDFERLTITNDPCYPVGFHISVGKQSSCSYTVRGGTSRN